MKKNAPKNDKYWINFVKETLAMVLPQELDNTDYANGGGYIQLSISTHAKFLLRYREIIENTAPELLESFDKNPAGFIGRYLDDGGNPAYALFSRALCIDNKLRMWGQPYFAAKPNEAKDICLANV
jgi:hypothetical protein